MPDRVSISPAQSELYADFIVRYAEKIQELLKVQPSVKLQMVNETYSVLYVPLQEISGIEINNYSYNSIPKCYTYMDLKGQTEAGIKKLQDHSYLKLKGRGTAIAIIDSGIDYTNPLFQSRNGSRIKWIWDQTLEGNDLDVPYGRTFTKKQIDEALLAENPQSIVPTMDFNGHGTALAALAAGNVDESNEFSGAAPEADLYIVKLKPAKEYLKELYLFPENAEVFQEDDIMLAISCILYKTGSEKLPVSICVGVGSNQGAHQGESHLSRYMDAVTELSQVSISVAAGNEGLERHHYAGNIMSSDTVHEVELMVGDKENGFAAELWAMPFGEYYFQIQSPTGEKISISNTLGNITQTMSFVFVETRILANYIPIELETGNVLLFLRFLHPAAGIWKILVQLKNGEKGQFHIWLPVKKLVSEATYFLEASPYTTVTTPGDAVNCITATAYDSETGGLFLNASRGYSMTDWITPDIAAPGVNMKIPLLNKKFGLLSGTSCAAALSAGAAALMLEWAIVRENEIFFTGKSVKYYFQRGAIRDESRPYPNKEWGYGKLNLYKAFAFLR